MSSASFPPYRVAVIIFFFIAGFVFASWASRIPDVQQNLHLSNGALGSLLFCLPIGLMCSLLLAGGAVSKFGSRNVLIVSAIIYSVILYLISFAQTAFQLGVLLFFFGMAGNMFNISVNTQAVLAEKELSRSIMASFHGAWSLAGFSGAGVGFLCKALALTPSQHFLISMLIGFALVAIAYRWLFSQNASGSTSKGFAWPDRSLLLLGLIAFGCLVCEGTMFDWSGVYFSRVIKAPVSLTSLGYTLFMACMATGRFAGDTLVNRFGRKPLIIVSGVIIFSGLMLSVLLPNIYAASIGFMLVGFGVSSVVPIVYSLAGSSKTMEAGRALAAVSTVGFFGFLAGPPLIGYIAELSSLRVSFLVVSFFGLLTTLLAFKLRR